MDHLDIEAEVMNNAARGPVEPVLQEQIPHAHIAAAQCLAIEYDRCLLICGPLVTYQRLKALMRRAEKLLPGGTR